MIKILHNLALFWIKNANFLLNFSAKIFKKSQNRSLIGRIFAHWTIVYYGQFFENYRSSPNFLGCYFQW
jgi:hypothetical protein